MRLEHFRYLLEIERQKSISSAARILHLSQTTLSSIVKAAEAELNFPIFKRTPNGVIATARGRDFLLLAQDLNLEYEKILHMKNEDNVSAHPISFLITPGINVSIALKLTQKYDQKSINGAPLIFVETPPLEIGPKMKAGKAAIGLTYFSLEELRFFKAVAEESNLYVDQIHEDHFFVLMRRDHMLAERKTIDIRELYQENIAYVADFHISRGNQMFYALNINNPRRFSYSNIQQAKCAVLKQNMVAILTGLACYADQSFYGEDALKAVPLSGLAEENILKVCLLRKHNHVERAAEQVLIESIYEYFRQLGPIPFKEEPNLL